MILYLHDGTRCSICERSLHREETFVGMPAILERCSMDQDLGGPVSVYLCMDCAVGIEEH